MNGVVLLRLVPDPESADREALIVDAQSLIALGQGLIWRRLSGARLAGLAVGPPSWEGPLREALALGLDSLTRVAVDASGPSDIVLTAAAIAEALPEETSVVFAGGAASDHGTGALPAAIAGVLDWPLLTEVTAASPSLAGLRVETHAGAGRRRMYEVAGPVVLTSAKGPPPPLYAPLARRFAAARTPIAVVQPPRDEEEAPRASRVEFLGYGPGRPRTKHLLKPDTAAKAGDRLGQLMSGGAQRTAGSKISGEPEDLARQLVDLLEKAGLLASMVRPR